MNILVYESTSGQILRNVQCSEEDAVLQVVGTEEYIPSIGLVDESLFYVSSGTIVPTPIKPTPHHQFNYTTKQWYDPRTPDTQWPIIRAQRNTLLSASDHTQLADSPRDKQSWATYRKTLRDITEQPDPFNIVWPAPPLQ